MRDRTFENGRYRASGLNLVVAAIIRWNTIYLELCDPFASAEGQDNFRRPADSSLTFRLGSPLI